MLSIDELGQLYSFGNIGALVDAGADEAGAPALRTELAGSSSDEGRWTGSLTHGWSVASGPGTGVFSVPDGDGIDTLVELTAAGTYTLRLAADDGQVRTFDDVAVTLTGVPYYDLWAGGFAGFTGAPAVYLANADFDDRTNLEEYGLGGSPMLAGDGTGHVPRLLSVEEGGLDYLEISYRRRRDAWLRGLTYTVERCDDLTASGWQTSGLTETGSVVIDVDFEEVTVRLDGPMMPESGPEFMRVRIEISE
jgi:hypothetical protein